MSYKLPRSIFLHERQKYTNYLVSSDTVAQIAAEITHKRARTRRAYANGGNTRRKPKERA